MMREYSRSSYGSLPETVFSQSCVKAVLRANISKELKSEMERFIARNVLDCGRVAPNCLKAHLVNTAKRQNLKERTIGRLKKLFRARIGFKGYYLDNGKLRKV